MESDEEEDSNSLLSLSHSLLQTDNGSTMTLTTNQTNTWSSSADGAVSDMVNQFSPVSPADSYHGQVLAASNDDGFNRFYNFRSSENHQQVNKSSSFIRTDSNAISVDSSFQSLTRINTGDFSHSGSGAGHGSGFFDQTLDARGSEEYINKDPENSFRSNQYEHIPQTRLDSTTKANQTNFNHNEGYDNIMNISIASESDGKMDIFESRTRQNNFIKDIDNFYEQSLNKSSMKSGPNNDILLDRKHVELSNFDVFDDFPSSKLDASLVTRINQQGSFHHQQGGFDMCQTSSVPKHSALISFLNSGSQLINSSTSIESTSKRIPPIPCSGFNGFNINEYVRSGSSSQKKPSFIQSNEIPSDFQPVFHSDFTGQQKLSPEPHVNFDHSNLADNQTISRQQSKSLQEPKDYVNKWSGRPRAHRKMARLLGSDVKEQFNIQETSKSSNGSVSHGKNSYQPVLQNDFASNGRNFLTMDEELDIRSSQQQERQFLRKGETLTRNQISQRELGFIQSAAFSLDATSMSSSSTKDSMNNILANQQFLIQSQLDLDFHSSLSQRDIDLSPHFGLQTVSKEFEADQSNVSAGQDLITFEQSHLQHINQQDLSLTDNLGLGSHHSQELNLDAYFATPSEKEVTFGRKSASDVQRDNSDTADFNIEEFMNHKDIGQVYFDRSDLPQDMTLYQKTEKQVSSEIPMVTKDKLRTHHSIMDKQSDISELQKELTKTSAKESMKGVRTPRDINRALEILQGLQEHEQEEERRKAFQLRQQLYQSSAIGASPKKTFHNKHLVEQMGISIQPFLGQSSHFIEDQSVNNLLDQSQLINDAHQDGNVLLTQYQQKSFIPVHQPNIVNGQNKKDSQNSHQNVSDLTYHAVKKFPNSMKDMSQSTSVFINQHSNLASMLTANNTVISELQNQEPRSVHFQGQQTELDSLAGKIQSHLGNLGAEPTAKRRNESVLIENRDKKIRVADANTQILEDFYVSASSRQQEDLLMSSRKSLYAMMTREEFCDAVLSTPKQTVKIHQAVLCSMSQYLSTLLLNMKPNPSTVAASSEPISPSTFYFSNSVSNQGVLLLVNCETIKPSSISAFLVFIYLGKTEFSESNILDLYILACSLKVTSLEDLCKKFMWSTQMPEDHIKVPQLLVFSHKSETKDQSSMAELGAPKVFEDKSINTVSNVKYMEVSTQTDRSTTESGGGGQEEWVMLKKTKQKTVSPSKGPLLNKSNQSCENIVSCKVGKKGWLSPKKHKLESPSEVVHASKDDFLKIGNIEVSKVKDAVQRLEEKNASNQQTFFQLVDTEQSAETNTDAPEKSFGINFPLECQKKLPAGSPLSHSGPSLHKRTTVEIAAAAAAAKLSAHSYGTRLARGNGRPPSYTALASVQEKKKTMSQKEKAITAVSKKKDFIKSNPPIEYSQSHNNVQLPTTESFQAILENKCEEKINTNKSASNTSNLSVKRPFKKSIVHRTQKDEFLRNAFTKDTFLDTESVIVKSDINSALMNEYMDTGDGNDCTFIDSIVNTIEAENMDFQKAISDLDNELNRSPPPAPTPVSSSVSSTSLASPLKSPQLSLATSESSSPVKAKSTPQGFRKRLIHMMNSENSTFLQVALPVSQSQAAMTLSSSQIDAQASVFQPSPEVTLNNCQPEPKQSSSTGEMTLPSKLNLDLTKPLNKSSSTCSEAILYNLKENYSCANSYLQNIEEEDLESPIQNKHSVSLLESSLNKHTLMNAMEACDIVNTSALKTQDNAVSSPLSNFSLMTDRDLGLKDSQIQSFDHKIFKRKKKIKVRKLPVSEVELLTPKSKKCDGENSLTKARQRKVTGSDSEGGGGGRLKKFSADRPQTQANVRPPPKKRAKMELELMKAANEVKTKNVDTKMQELEKCCVSENASDASTPTCAVQENGLATIVEVTSDRNRTTVDQKPPMNKVGQNLNKSSLSPTDQSIIEKDNTFLEETKLTSMLESKIKKTNCKKPITCTLCQSKFRRARRAVKHVLNHGVSSSDVMDNISFGQGEEQEACGVCGYVTKDQSYHYMHYHKYFKHGIPLPMGWKADRCEICGKECFNKFQLKEHMHTHKEGQGYICWICGQSFRSRNCFNSHVFHKHNQIRKYKCKVCEKCFKTWTQLKVHVRSHTGERPFSCTECEHRSSTQGNMRLHLTTHGLGKDKIQELMEKIAKNVTEMTPESLEQIMDNLVKETSANKKVDLKQPACKKTKSHAKSRQSTRENNKSDEKKSRKLVPDLKPKSLLLKFEGTELKKIFTQPLSQVEPPKLLRSLLNKTVANGNDITEEEKSSIQVNQNDKSEPGLVLDMGSLRGMLQQMPASLPPATTVFIPMPDQDQVLQQQQFLQHAGTTNQSLLGYTAVPTFFLSGQTGSLDSGGSILTISDLTSSGLGVMSQTIQLVQPKGMSSVQLGGQDLVADNFIGNFVNVPVSEYTVISSGTDNCEGETVTLKYDFEDHGGEASAGRVLVGDDIVDIARNGENLRISGASSFGNILYLDSNSQSDKTLKVENSGKAEASSPVLVVVKNEPASEVLKCDNI